ncbi:MAG: hypothetical protein QXL82_02860 [Candidatus Aenigmatarchaeota archaeon]
MPYTKTIRFIITIPANQAANSVLAGNNAQVVADPIIGAQNMFVIPSSETWFITDIYVKSSPSIDVVLRIKKNRDYKLETPPVSALLVSNPSRPQLPVLMFEPNSQLSIEAVNLAAGGASATTVEVFATVEIYP